MQTGGGEPTFFNIAGRTVGVSLVSPHGSSGPVGAAADLVRQANVPSNRNPAPSSVGDHGTRQASLSKFTYAVKIYNPVRRSQFVWRDLHNVTCKFQSVAALRSALYHELENDVPDTGDYNIGYFEGRQQKKKWLVGTADLEAMYTLYKGKPHISLWCDGKDQSDGEDSSDEERERPSKRPKRKKSAPQSKESDREEELESIFHKLSEKHGKVFSGPQVRLWARMIVAKTHDSMDEPPKVPMFTGVSKQARKDTLTDAFASAATAIAKAFSPSPSPESKTTFSPSKKIDLRMKNLDQLRLLQQLREDGILTQDEFLSQKKIVIASLDHLV